MREYLTAQATMQRVHDVMLATACVTRGDIPSLKLAVMLVSETVGIVPIGLAA
jgi:hypothetical protein